MKNIRFLLLVIVLLSFISCKWFTHKPPTVRYNVKFGSGAGCNKKGICTHSPGNVPGYFELHDSTLLVLSFSVDTLTMMDPSKVADFVGKTTYTFEEPWVAPKALDSQLHATRPIIVLRGNYPIVIKHGVCYIRMALVTGHSIGTTLDFGHGPMCPGKGVCDCGATGVNAKFTYYPGLLTLNFSLLQLGTMPSPQREKVADFLPPNTIYTFDADWVMPPNISEGLGTTGPLVIHAGIPNNINLDPDGNNCTITFNLTAAPPPIPPGGG